VNIPRKTFGVVVFPGSNCDHDAQYVLEEVMGQQVELLWHKETSLRNVDAIVLPGGFSYGDYLRCGAIARFSPIMKEVIAFARSGGVVVGICNGFQILCEAGLLPGVLLRNESLSFVCKFVNVRVEHTNSPFTAACRAGEVLRIPIAHGDGNYFADESTLRHLEVNGQVLFRYCDADGSLSSRANPNGSLDHIAGITNEAGNVMGMMPHPERSADPALGPTDGQKIFRSIIQSIASDATIHYAVERS
jgi:phosphoribosylformylglycinamidine synthase